MTALTRTATTPAGKPGFGASTIDTRSRRYRCDQCEAATDPLTVVDALPAGWRVVQRGHAMAYRCPACAGGGA